MESWAESGSSAKGKSLPQFSSQAFPRGRYTCWWDSRLPPLSHPISPTHCKRAAVSQALFWARHLQTLISQEMMPETDFLACVEKANQGKQAVKKLVDISLKLTHLATYRNELLLRRPLFPTFSGSVALIRKSQVPEWGAKLWKFKQNDIFQEELD